MIFLAKLISPRLIFVFSLVLSSSVVAENPRIKAEHKPQICTGVLSYPEETRYGIIYTQPPEVTSVRCPENFAVYGNLLLGRAVNRNPASVALRATCCPLPANDILAEATTEIIDRCPENYVAVGATQKCNDCDPLLLCQAINSNRYMLGVPKPGLQWGLTSSPWKYRDSALKSDIPRGVRIGVTRAARFESYSFGCVGYPFGSMLTGKTGKWCTTFLYSELQYRGIDRDPPMGTPVHMYRDCRNLSQADDGEFLCND